MKLKFIAAYVGAALACWVQPPQELLYGPQLKGPMVLETNSGAANQFAGFTTLNSGTAYVTISTAIINSDSLVTHGFKVSTTTNSGIGLGQLAVSSVVPGVSFAIGQVDGVGRAPGGTVMWEVRRTS